MQDSKACIIDNCNFHAHKNGKCILHCEKDNDLTTEELRLFTKYIYTCRKEEIEPFYNKLLNEDNSDRLILKEDSIYLLLHNLEEQDELQSLIKARRPAFALGHVVFPTNSLIYEDYIDFNYLQYFRNLTVTFIECVFNSAQKLFITYSHQHYYRCNFTSEIYLNDEKPDFLKFNKKFMACTFHQRVEIEGVNENKKANYSIEKSTLFFCCNFKTTLNIRNLTADFIILANTYEFGSINELNIENSSLYGYLSLEYSGCTNLTIKDSTLYKKINLKDTTLETLSIINSSFKDSVYFNHATINKIEIQEICFEKIFLFDECVTKSFANFYNVLFQGTANFKGSNFQGGLSLASSTFETAPNFFNTKIIRKNTELTDRETYRIIKHALDSVGNKIDANRFYAEEMSVYHNELHNEQNAKAQLWLMNINKWTSNYGQSYVRPSILLLVAMFIHNLIIKFYLPSLDSLKTINLPAIWKDFLNPNQIISQTINIVLHKDTSGIEGFEFISFIFYVIYAILIYQLIVALKRHTKR